MPRSGQAFCLIFFASLVAVTGCRDRTAGMVNSAAFENDASAALVRTLVSEIDVVLGETAQTPHCVVAGPRLQKTSEEFAARFQESGKTFILETELTVDPSTKMAVVKKTRIPPVIIQLAVFNEMGEGHFEAIAAWSHIRRVVRKKYQVRKSESGEWVVEPGEVLEEKS